MSFAQNFDAVMLLSGVTTGTGSAYAPSTTVRDLTFLMVGTGTISAGTLVLEEAPQGGYGGTWSQIGSSVDLTTITAGKCVAVHLHGIYASVRPRVTVNITGGGTIDVLLIGG